LTSGNILASAWSNAAALVLGKVVAAACRKAVTLAFGNDVTLAYGNAVAFSCVNAVDFTLVMLLISPVLCSWCSGGPLLPSPTRTAWSSQTSHLAKRGVWFIA
jgi:hypothetical protein